MARSAKRKPRKGHDPSRCIAPPAWLYFVLAIAGWINRGQQLVIEYLLCENRVLRAMNRTGRKQPTDRERRVLAVKAMAAGMKALRKLQTAFSPDTLLRWHRKLIALKWTFPNQGAGRPRIPKDIEDLIVFIAKEVPGAGYTDILNRIRNVGITEDQASRTTIANILKRHGIEPAPERRKGGSWWTFLKAHWQGLAAATSPWWRSLILATWKPTTACSSWTSNRAPCIWRASRLIPARNGCSKWLVI
jgi:hypothetical protein